MTVDTDKKYREKVEAASNMIFQLKQLDQLNKGYNEMAIPAVDKFVHVSIYPMI